MKTIISILIVFVLSLSFITGIKAQNDTTGMNDANSTIKITVDSKAFPKELKAGESFEFGITIHNISKFSEWTYNYLTIDVESNFKVVKSRNGKAVLGPGDSDIYYFKATAPNTKGEENLKITFLNYGKKKKKIEKKIEITGNDDMIKEEDKNTNGNEKQN